MAQDTDVLLGLYLENCNQGRHHESMRATVTGVFLTIAAGVTSVIALDQKIDRADVPLSLFIVFVGVFGALMAAKHYERVQSHNERAREYRDALEALLPSTKIKALKKTADARHKEKWRFLSSTRLFWLWIGLQITIAVFGAILAIIAMRP